MLHSLVFLIGGGNVSVRTGLVLNMVTLFHLWIKEGIVIRVMAHPSFASKVKWEPRMAINNNQPMVP